jgi:predicted RNase H-like HicB family nuclease
MSGFLLSNVLLIMCYSTTMNIQQAKANLEKFLGDKMLTFAIRKYRNGEWVAECNELPAIMTGGMGDDLAEIDRMIRDAILTAAGIDPLYSEQVLKFVDLKRPTSWLPSPFRSSITTREREAEYVIA